jgi:hypothetical protein
MALLPQDATKAGESTQTKINQEYLGFDWSAGGAGQMITRRKAY